MKDIFWVFLFFSFGVFTSIFIFAEQYYIYLTLISILYFFVLNLKTRFYIFVIAALFPLSFGNVGSIEGFLWIEWMGLLFFLNILILLVQQRQTLIPKGIGIYIDALFILAIWAIISYLKNPVTSKELMGVSESSGGIRSYYIIFIGIVTFFCTMWFTLYFELKYNNLLGVLMLITIIFGIIRVLSYFFNIDTPLLYGDFRYAPPPTIYKGSVAHRIGGLDIVTTVGFSSFIAYYYGKKWNLAALLLIIISFAFSFLGGGRTIFFASIFAAIIYLILFEKKKIYHMLPIVILIIITLNILISIFPIPNQMNRIFSVEGGFEKQSMPRFLIFNYYFNVFLKSPIIGKGIGFKEYGVTGDYLSDFIAFNLDIGGHSAYLSILALFGIGGFFFLIVMLYKSIFTIYGLLKKVEFDFNGISKNFGIFILIYLIITAINYIVAYSGFNDLSLYLLAGFTAGILAKVKSNKSGLLLS